MCCGCVNMGVGGNGIYLLMGWYYFQTFYLFVQGLFLLLALHWSGLVILLLYSVYVPLCKFFYDWYKDDTLENREQVLKGFKWVLFQCIGVYSLLVLVVLMVNPDSLPDKYEDAAGNVWEVPDFIKKDIKYLALYFLIIIGGGSIFLQFYYFKVVRQWSEKETWERFQRVMNKSGQRNGSMEL